MALRLTLLCFLLLGFVAIKHAAAFAPEVNSPEKHTPEQTYTVYIFLSETCPISQFYTLTLKELHNEFSGAQFSLIGIFPNSYSSPEAILEFRKKYDLPFELKPDPEQQLTKALKATITPEVIVQQNDTGQIVYKGRIDDAYFRVGKRRAKVNEPDLKNALTQLRNKQQITTPETAAVGCYIMFKQ